MQTTPNEVPRKRILVVDDDRDLAQGLARILRTVGLEVSCVGDAQAALDAVTQGASFDAIVADVAMPGLSGLDGMRAIRRFDPDVPVLMITGAPNVQGAMAAIEFGAFRYLSKPIDPGMLVDSVLKALRVPARSRPSFESISAEWSLDEAHAAQSVRTQTLERGSRFRRALGSLRAAFQPIVSWRERRVFGFEGLVRCPEPGLERPDALFDLAERLGQLPALGRAIRERVAEEVALLPADASLFVNVHPADVLDETLFDRSSPLTPFATRIVLEITERASISDVFDLAERVKALRDLGYRIAVDDLGAGYAGLSSFSLLEPDIVKLDMSLVRGIDLSERKRRVVRSLIQLCEQELGVRVVCEGIETVAERDVVVSLGADLLQGYLFAEPSWGFPEPAAGSLPVRAGGSEP